MLLDYLSLSNNCKNPTLLRIGFTFILQEKRPLAFVDEVVKLQKWISIRMLIMHGNCFKNKISLIDLSKINTGIGYCIIMHLDYQPLSNDGKNFTLLQIKVAFVLLARIVLAFVDEGVIINHLTCY